MNEHNEQLAHALNTWPESARPRLRFAAHEIGHALAFIAHGIQPEWVRLDFGILDGLNGGVCRISEPEPDLGTPPEQIEVWLIGALAGHAAEARFGRVYLGLDDQHAYQWGSQGAGQDYANFHRLRTTHRVRLSEQRAYQRACLLIERHGARVDHLTWRLARARHLAGSAL